MKNTNHLVFDIKLKEKIKIENVEKMFDEIVKKIKVRVLKKENHIFDNGGLTLFYLLAESHISGHYRIEDDYLALDIYSCNYLWQIYEEVENIIKDILSVESINTTYLKRWL